MFKLQIEQNALQDIQEITDWYNSQLKDLGARFQKQLKSQINSLKTNPHIYALRYANVHCMGVKKFPFLVHFTINDDDFVVSIFPIIHNSRNPKIWEVKRNL